MTCTWAEPSNPSDPWLHLGVLVFSGSRLGGLLTSTVSCAGTEFENLYLQTYAFDNQTLAAIEVAVLAVLEGMRYNGYKKTGSVRKDKILCIYSQEKMPHMMT